MPKENQQFGNIDRRTFLIGCTVAVGSSLIGGSFLDFLVRSESLQDEVDARLAELYPDVEPVTSIVTSGAGPAVASAEVVIGYDVDGVQTPEEKDKIIKDYAQESKRLTKESETAEDILRDKIDIGGGLVGLALVGLGGFSFRKNRREKEEGGEDI